MPQSRHRKTSKAKKRPKGLYPAAKAKPHTPRSRQARIIAIVAVLLVAGLVIGYLVSQRGGSGQAEIRTPSGLRYVELKEGTGPTPQKGQTVTVHYTGTLLNGTKFDSSYDHPGGQPSDFRIGVGAVIKGWDEGLMSMKVGGKRRFTIPPALGYGPQGMPPNIPGNSTLLFDVELLGVK